MATPAPSRSLTADDERERVVTSLAALSLPFMWSLRQRAMQVLSPLGLRPTRVLLLELVNRGFDRPTVIADTLEAVPPAVTAMINELTEKGLLRRERDATDRRRAHLRLTPEGEALLCATREAWFEASRHDLERFELDDLKTVLSVFERLLDGRA